MTANTIITNEEIDAALMRDFIWLAPITDHERSIYRAGIVAGMELAARKMHEEYTQCVRTGMDSQ